MNLRRIKVLSAVIGGGAIAMGAFVVVLGVGQVPTAESAPEVSYGETKTSETGVTEIETSVATPPVEVELPDGYGMG